MSSASASTLFSLPRQLASHASVGQVAFIRHAARNELLGNKEQRDAEPITEAGAAAATNLSAALNSTTRVIGCLWLGSQRTEQTARALSSSLTHLRAQVQALRGVATVRLPGYEDFKQQHGWDETVRLWVSGALSATLLLPPTAVVNSIARAVLSAASSADIVPREGEVLLVATHDVYIFALYASLRGQPVTAVPFLDGIAVPWTQIQEVAARGDAAEEMNQTQHGGDESTDQPATASNTHSTDE